MALGLAAVFTRVANQLPGRVRVVLQPAEEVTPSGAVEVLAAGAADGCCAALGLHCDPARDLGTIGLKVGTLTSMTDVFDIRVYGEAGHTARPHLARDAIRAAAAVVAALYDLIRRVVDPLEHAVLAVGMIHGGDAENIIAGSASVKGTVRSFEPEVRTLLHREVRRAAEAAAACYGCSADVDFRLGSPSIVNDAALDGEIEAAVRAVLGPGAIQRIPKPSTGAEDFGQFSARLPTYMIRLGVHTPGRPTMHLHTPTFEPDERAIGHAMRIMARALLSTLQRHA